MRLPPHDYHQPLDLSSVLAEPAGRLALSLGHIDPLRPRLCDALVDCAEEDRLHLVAKVAEQVVFHLLSDSAVVTSDLGAGLGELLARGLADTVLVGVLERAVDVHGLGRCQERAGGGGRR